MRIVWIRNRWFSHCKEQTSLTISKTNQHLLNDNLISIPGHLESFNQSDFHLEEEQYQPYHVNVLVEENKVAEKEPLALNWGEERGQYYTLNDARRNENGVTNHQKQPQPLTTYSCFMCGKSFVSRYYVDRHVRVHSGEKPFKCLKCGRCFSQRENLKRHEKLHLKQNDTEKLI